MKKRNNDARTHVRTYARTLRIQGSAAGGHAETLLQIVADRPGELVASRHGGAVMLAVHSHQQPSRL